MGSLELGCSWASLGYPKQVGKRLQRKGINVQQAMLPGRLTLEVNPLPPGCLAYVGGPWCQVNISANGMSQLQVFRLEEHTTPNPAQASGKFFS